MRTRIESWARDTMKHENVLTIGTRPSVAIPAAMPSMFCSVIPIWKKRSG